MCSTSLVFVKKKPQLQIWSGYSLDYIYIYSFYFFYNSSKFFFYSYIFTKSYKHLLPLLSDGWF